MLCVFVVDIGTQGDGWMDGRMDEWIDGRLINARVVGKALTMKQEVVVGDVCCYF